jgi:hypothetical protein
VHFEDNTAYMVYYETMLDSIYSIENAIYLEDNASVAADLVARGPEFIGKSLSKEQREWLSNIHIFNTIHDYTTYNNLKEDKISDAFGYAYGKFPEINPSIFVNLQDIENALNVTRYAPLCTTLVSYIYLHELAHILTKISPELMFRIHTHLLGYCVSVPTVFTGLGIGGLLGLNEIVTLNTPASVLSLVGLGLAQITIMPKLGKFYYRISLNEKIAKKYANTHMPSDTHPLMKALLKDNPKFEF